MAGTAKIFLLRRGRKKLLWRAKVLSTHAEITRGIIGCSPEFEPALFIFPRSARWRNSIHSLFCPPFDALFLSEQFFVVDAVRVKPFNPLVSPRARAKFLIELPAGEASRKRVVVGDELKAVFSLPGIR